MSLSKSKCLYSNNCLQFLKRVVPFIMSKKSTCQFKIKFITDDYLQLHKTLQPLTSIFTNIKVIKNMYEQTQQLLKMPSAIKLGLNLTAHCSGHK
jgi:hypothetical protein